jgi:dihydrofolate reductase
MGKVCCDVSISAGGYLAGPGQTREKPFGEGPVVGGAAMINQYLAAGLIDEFRTHIAPVTAGAGERLFEGVPPLNLEIRTVRGASLVTHISDHVVR